MQLYFGARSSRVMVVRGWRREGEGRESVGEKERETAGVSSCPAL